MNKEYHYTISRTDRIYLVSFVIILLGWELIKECIPATEKTFTYVSPPSAHHGFKVKKNFRSTYFTSPKYEYAPRKKFDAIKYSTYEDEQEQPSPSAPIHIMTASIDELISMGLSKKVAYAIQKYISKGGNITNEKDLLKIYGMDSLQLMNALPFIIFDSLTASDKATTISINETPVKSSLDIIDLNLATAEDLESLDGIGIVLANRIIKYREAIGGFISADQLKECFGIPPETMDKIKNHITVSGSPHLIFINTLNLDSLRHPYLSKKQIKLIKAYKLQHGEIKDVSVLRKIYPPDSTWCDRVLPYISFELNK